MSVAEIIQSLDSVCRKKPSFPNLPPAGWLVADHRPCQRARVFRGPVHFFPGGAGTLALGAARWSIRIGAEHR
jgi:hypothetical protein